jgi:hypothetical protein
MVMASPATTWSVRRVIVAMAWMSQHPEVGVVGVVGSRETAHRPHDHGAFESEIEDAGAFGEDLPHGGEDQRCAGEEGD